MKSYVLTRLALIIPSLFLMSLVAFSLSKMTPQDPVISLIQLRGNQTSGDFDNVDLILYKNIYQELGLDKPSFYFSITPNHYPASLNPISDPHKRSLLKSALKQGIPFEKLKALLSNEQLSNEAFEKAIEEKQLSSNSFYLPKFHWFGTNNQFHRWFKGILSGDFGHSLMNGQEVTKLVGKALLWTVIIGFFSLILAFTLGIYFGYFLAKNPMGRKQKILDQILYLLYSMPKFWVGTMVVIFLTTNDYGSWTNIFPSVGMDIHPERSTVVQVLLNFSKLLLPILVLSSFSIAYIARLLRKSILNEMAKPYIKTAFTKGLSKSAVLKHHALPNALMPIITIFIGALPVTLAGSVVVEVIFNIPGVGRLVYDSIHMADWNVIFCILLLMGFITMLSYLIGDILYSLVDPKIKFA